MAEDNANKSEKPAKKSFLRRYLPLWIAIIIGGIIFAGVMIYDSMPLDEILLYEVNAQVQSDGTLTNTYHIRWKVLDDTREGALSWVQIGMPNQNWSLVSFGGVAASVSNTNELYIYVYLDRNYQKGEIADFTFTVSQKDMLCFSNAPYGPYMIDFAPGWFPKIKVDEYRFTMSPASIAAGGNQDADENGALVWAGSLKKNGHREMTVYFPASAFDNPQIVGWQPIDYSVNSDGSSGNADGEYVLVILAIMIVIIILLINTNYSGGRGFYGGGGYYRGGFFGGGGGGGCACAGCACACACAGGGRAGCNVKEFGIKLKVQNPERRSKR